VTEIAVRRARPGDLDFLLELVNDPDVQPFLGARAAYDRDALLGQIERSEREPDAYGRFVIEAGAERAGSVVFDRTNERSRIANLGGLALHPRFRGRGIADEAARRFARHLLLELGFHRLELEISGFNERAQRHAERVGYVREGVKRQAYWRHGDWADAVLYSMLVQDLEP
jgi:RimJ/RimL family protein N-acetyltransferase